MKLEREWLASDTGTGENDILLNGNRMLTGNGYMGYRGTVEEAVAADMPATIVNGVYDKNGDKWREPVCIPNALSIRLETASGRSLSLRSESLFRHSQSLDFRYGIFRRHTEWRFDGNTAPGERGFVRVESERFVSMTNAHLLCERYLVTTDMELNGERLIDGNVRDINGPHLESFVCSCDTARRALILTAETMEKKLSVAVVSASAWDTAPAKNFFSGKVERFTIQGTPICGSTYCLYVFAGVSAGEKTAEAALAAASSAAFSAEFAGGGGHSADAHTAGGDSASGGHVPSGEYVPSGACVSFAAERYMTELNAHRAEWDSIWERGDVEITGDEFARRALRYNLYHLQIIAPRFAAPGSRDVSGGLSVPARGLSGQTYKGAIFWDTEMFISPYFLYTEPEMVKRFIRYRVETLDGARRKAAEYGYSGAFYAWESQETGDDACSLHNVTDVFTGRPMRTYFRDKQIHISGAVVHAVREYLAATGDFDILRDGALEMVLECARFYLSRIHYSPLKKRYEVLDVTGPDEYHERVNNDAYTNRIVKDVFDTAEFCIAEAKVRAPETLASVMDKIRFTDELPLMRAASADLYVPAPGADGIIEQFDGYFQLENCSLQDVRSRLLDPKEYWGGANGVASETQIIKQADVILLQTVFPDEYTEAQKRVNFAYYEPRTEHGSSLSPCVYALLACAVGDTDWAYPFFLKTAEIDITGESKQFAGLVYIGGTHPAANGGAWLSAVRGFCGFSVTNGEIRVAPRLPPSWEEISFSAVVRGAAYRISITKDGYTICKK
ncbi:glycosyl hydrolase family 65 protein [Treponema brennaborense]|uniref:Kojibiose phosphorylase n=1 Tax=Treponema brennaborense (strain DSM 12168 / CIP 105900 / DD5/3) TaxID=906968 RepID=F4LLV0_TREBD|nr:glycosyl hydrolase family 65 protein [Treponema brennaborense]AEE15642.1 Kojibiose phosphorylase [Treponema brennaborense DSM 12168]